MSEAWIHAGLRRVLAHPRVRRSALLRSMGRSLRQAWTDAQVPATALPELTPLEALPSAETSPRLNLLVPSVNPEHVFGGIATGLRVFRFLLAETGWAGRIVVTDDGPRADGLANLAEFPAAPLEDDAAVPRRLVAANDRYGRRLPVRRHDVFLATAWWTAYSARAMAEGMPPAQRPRAPLLYLVQDFEPGFYPWSTRYMLALSTYRAERTVPIFNTSLLRDYFVRQDLPFAESYCFEPALHPRLRSRLEAAGAAARRKRLLVYGRPGVERNAFALIVAGLEAWLAQDREAREWEFVSAGQPHPDIPLAGGGVLRAVGRLDLEAYADLLESASLGLSLMVSPHPSYPPLEMACFGVRVLTNHFANKDLGGESARILSLDALTPASIAAALSQLARHHGRPLAPLGPFEQAFRDGGEGEMEPLAALADRLRQGAFFAPGAAHAHG